jgi:hypothetical protein
VSFSHVGEINTTEIFNSLTELPPFYNKSIHNDVRNPVSNTINLV